MKNSDLRKLIANHKEIQIKLKKRKDKKLRQDLKEIEHRYFHETGKVLDYNINEI